MRRRQHQQSYQHFGSYMFEFLVFLLVAFCASSWGCQAFIVVFREQHPAISTSSSSWKKKQQQQRNNMIQHATRQDQDEQRQQQERQRIQAGTEGYSVMRQPLSRSNWGSDNDPNFDIPLHLDENSLDEQLVQAQDEDWWSNRSSLKRTGLSSSSSLSRRKNDNDKMDTETEKSVDLFQRTLETLDYPRILDALQEECTTAPARTIVRQALLHQPQTGEDDNNNNNKQLSPFSKRKKKIPQCMHRAYQPLVANTVHGAQERYQAVQEMEWLLLQQNHGNNKNNYNSDNDNADDNFFQLLQETTYRDRLGRKQRLGAPPPTLGNSFDLDRLLSPLLDNGSVDDVDNSDGGATTTRRSRRRVLEGIEIAQIIDMMDIMENVQLWGQALRRVNQQHAEEQKHQHQHEHELSKNNKKEFVQLPQFAVDCIQVNTTLHDLLHNAFEDDGNDTKNKQNSQRQQQAVDSSSSSFGKLSSRTFPVLGQLRARIRALRLDITQTLDTLIAMPSIQSKLAMESGGPIVSEVANSGRLVLPIAAKYATSIGIVHDSSRSGKTSYVEPTEIVGPTNELRQTEGELRAEEARIWRMLTLQILDNAAQLQASAFAVGQLDLVVARMWLGQRRLFKARIPIVMDEGIIAVQQAQHPVLLLREMKNVVGSNVELGKDGNQGLVLTGPNAGGKTVILKLLGLFALMARAGIPVPANRNHDDSDGSPMPPPPPRVDFFNPVLADIGDLQSVGGDLSTFSGHMLVCRQVLQNAKRNALVLMDELGSGTDPAQGVAIAQALLEALVEAGCRVAITTHYMQLKQLAASDDRFAVGGMQFVQGRPTYRLLPGTVGESFALAVAERLELPKSVISRANELLDSETRQMGDLIRELEDQKTLVDEQVLELQEKKREMQQLELKLQEQRVKLEREQLNARREEARKFARKLEEKEQLMQDILKNLQSDPSRRLIAKSWEDIKLVKRSVLNEAEQVPSVVARQQKAAFAVEQASAALVPLSETAMTNLNPGDVLVVCKKGPLFAREAVVEQTLGRNRVEVRVNNMNVAMKLSEVALPPTGANRNKVVEAAAFVPTRRVGNNNERRGNAISKAASDAIAREGNQPQRTNKWDESLSSNEESNKSGSSVEMRTMSNTVDVRGCTLMEAQAKIKDKFSACLMSGRGRFVYILHGHGSQGILKSKIRSWLQSEKQLVRNFQPASAADGGDAFTRVELK